MGCHRFNGNIEGEITSEGNLFVGDKSVIKADIKVNTITVEGKIFGNITATRQLVILSSAEVYGNIKTPSLQIEEGAKFQGTCDMEIDVQKPKSITYNKTKDGKVVSLKADTQLKEVA